MKGEHMTRRERLERKLELREEWAEGRQRKAGAAFNTASKIADNIPLGQPILIGHHSEKHARRDQERIQNAMRRGVESSNMAEYHESKAAGIQNQLDRSIFSDDPDALEALTARIQGLEAERERLKAINKEIRKGAGWSDRLNPPLTEDEKAMLLRGARYGGTDRIPAYYLTNLGANIRRLKERMKDIKVRQQRIEQAETNGGVSIVRNESANWCTVTFAEKPEREILDALRAAGYHWGGGSWNGYLDKLPEIVGNLAHE
jgi:hypothetical protein